MNDDPLPDSELRGEDCAACTEDGISLLPEVQDLFSAKEDTKKEPFKVPIKLILESKKGVRL